MPLMFFYLATIITVKVANSHAVFDTSACPAYPLTQSLPPHSFIPHNTSSHHINPPYASSFLSQELTLLTLCGIFCGLEILNPK